jgi:hypothetical protein
MASRNAIGPGRNEPKREPDMIVVEGAREHNLLVDRLELPKPTHTDKHTFDNLVNFDIQNVPSFSISIFPNELEY